MAEGHFNTRTAFRLAREDRLKELRPAQLLEKYAGLLRSVTCIDLGCGTGTFSFEMAEIAGRKGLVLAIDDSQKMLDIFRKSTPPANVVLIKGDVLHTPVNDGSADFCLLAFILHELQDHRALISEANRTLKPGGKIMVVEWKANLRSPGPPKNKRIKADYLEGLLSDNFHFVDLVQEEWSYHHYVVTAVKGKV